MSEDARRLGRSDLYSVAELATPAHLPVDRSVAGLLRAGVPWPRRPRSAVRARSSDSGQKDRRNGTGCRERYVAADHLEAEVEDLYDRIEVPTDWVEGLRQAIADEVATRHEDTTAERELLATPHERLESERYKLMGAYYANAIDVTMLRREQDRIGAELRSIESREAVLDGSLDDWQDVMDLALRFSARCATAYRRADDRTRRLLNAAVLDEVHVRDGHVVEATYKEPFDLLFSSPKFEWWWR